MPSEIEKLKTQNKSLEYQRSFAWAKYYSEVRDRHLEQVVQFTTTDVLLNTIEEQDEAIPQFVVNELNDLHKQLKTAIECPICYEILDNFELSKCGHKYCITCLDKLIETSNKCALCKKQLKWKKNLN